MERLLNIKEVTELFGVTEACVRAWVINRKIGFVKVGKLVRFRQSDIDTFVKEGGNESNNKN